MNDGIAGQARKILAEQSIEKDNLDGIKAEARYVTINELFDLRCQLKRGLKNNAFENYKYMYNTFVRPNFGKLRISTLKKSDVKRFYNHLADERGLQASTIDSVHTVLYQVLNMAVDDNYIRNNPSENVLKELKQSHVFKTEKRQVPMLDFVKEAFIMERDYQQALGIKCEATVDGYSDFIFVNRHGATQHQGTLNKTIRRIIRDCNDAVLLKGEENPVLLPHFSCHSLRHTFTTRMCEAGVNIKIMQDTLGHADISTTLNIYADVTKELKREEFAGLDSYFKGTVTSDGTSKDAPKGKKKGRKRTA